jgi:hypothetical protein
MADKVKVFKYKFVDDSGNIIEESTSKLSVLEAAVKKTSEALKGADIGSKNFKDLKESLEQNEKAFAKADSKSKGFVKSMESIPGPIGQVSQGFSGLGKAATAFIANPIGAVIAALGLVFTAVYKAITSTEKGMFALNKIMGIFSGVASAVIKPIGELAALFAEKLAGGIEAVMSGLKLLGIDFGNAAEDGAKLAQTINEIDEAEGDLAVARAQQNKELAAAKELLTDTNASYKDRKAALDQIKAAEEALAQKEVDLAKKTLKAAQDKIDLQGKSKENLDAEEAALIKLAQTEEAYFAKQRQFNKEEKKLKAEDDAAQKERQKAADDRRKQELADRKAAGDKIRQIDQENQLASIADEEQREIKAQEFAKAAALREIDQMKLTKGEKARLIEEIDEKNKLKLLEIDDKYNKQQEKKDEEDAAKKAKFEEDVAKALADTREEKFALEQQETQKHYDELIALAGADTERGKALIEARNAKLKEGQDKFNQETIDAAQKTAEAEAKIEEEKVKAKADAVNASLDIVASAGALLSQLAGENKKLAIAGVIVEQGAAVGKVITATQIANAGALATPQAIATSGVAAVPVITKNNIMAGISIATIIAGAAKAIGEINKAETPDAGQKAGGAKVATSYAQGGLLTGRTHAQGGIATPMGELEGGEYVVNRKSTASFLPLLTSINEMGAGGVLGMGNVSSGMENAGLNSAPPIIKTYVVASDVSSQQEADKLLTDLARL